MGTRILLAVVLLLPLVLNGELNMPGGTGSTLTIKPNGRSDLTMGLEGGEYKSGATPYIVPSQTLDFNESQRQQVVYDVDTQGEGGRDILETRPLVPVTFQVVIKSQTRAELIDAYNDLHLALTNPTGGRVVYKPEDLAAGVLDTHYYYVRSRPPDLVQSPGNRWDAPATSQGYFTLLVSAKFMTQPVATSDPDSPVTLAELSATVENWVDAGEGQSNEVTVSASNVKGTLPALLRLTVRPSTSGHQLGRLVMFKRDIGTIANFVSILEAEDAAVIEPCIAWNEAADSDRGDDAYMFCGPTVDAYGLPQGLRFTIANPADHEGRFAVFGIGRDESGASGVWSHQVKLRVGNVIQTGLATWTTSDVHRWTMIFVGEFELPPTRLSGLVTAYHEGPYLDWYSSRASGWSLFKLDALALIYVADDQLQPTALDILCTDENGFGVTTTEKLVIENFPDDRGQATNLAGIIAQSDDDFKRALIYAPRGDFFTVSPEKDTLFVFFQVRSAETVFEDDFASYIANFWLPIGDMETDETWYGSGDCPIDTTNYVEGSQGHRTGGSGADECLRDNPMDLDGDGRFTDDDFVVIAVYAASSGSVNISFSTDPPNGKIGNYYYDSVAVVGGWNYLQILKSDFAEVGAPTGWDNIERVAFWLTGVDVTGDAWRIEAADPDDATNPNATGQQWDFQPAGASWTVVYEASNYVLACLEDGGAVEKSALIDATIPDNMSYRARVMVKKADGQAGIVWRSGDDTLTAGTEDCYVAFVDTNVSPTLRVGEYVNGVWAELDSVSFTAAKDTWYTIGVIVKGDTFEIYGTASSNLTDDDNVFDSTYLRLTVTDATYSSGKCGVMCASCLGRWDNVKIVNFQEGVIPADQIVTTGQAIFRTLAPFAE